MALNLKLQMRLSQQLIMTPQLQQAIKLLQLSRHELEDLIGQQLIENPVLEEGESEGEVAGDKEEISARIESVEPVTAPVVEKTTADEDWENYMEASGGVIQERYGRDDGEEANLEATLAQGDNLPDHLLWQLDMNTLSPVEYAIGEHVIGNLDDDGYLTLSVADLLHQQPHLQADILAALKAGSLTLTPVKDLPPELLTARHLSVMKEDTGKKKPIPPVFAEDDEGELDVDENDMGEALRTQSEQAPPEPQAEKPVDLRAAGVVEAVIRHLHTYDPTGVAARNLRECLLIQLRLNPGPGSLPYQIVDQDLKLLEARDLKKIARRHKVELPEALEAYRFILSLEPKPGRPFARMRAQHIIPDVYIFKYSTDATEGEDQVGHYRVVLNETGLPRLRINDYYRQIGEAKDGGDNALTKEYIQEKIKAGNWLMKSIEQRQKTILKVTRSILKHQYEFFERGIDYLKPLVLKDVAEDIAVHESTVSRITTNKYVHTPQGIFELKYFFTSGIAQDHGEVISSKKIKDMIQRIIAEEDAKEPKTDIEIAEILFKESQIRVARRTVAKYREALNVLPSNRRKQLY